MARVYTSICEEADSLFVQITKLAEKEIRYKVEIEKVMNVGFVDIAKARYIMGSTCVTKMQLPSEKSNPIQPVATVCRAEKNNHWVFHIHRKDVPPRREVIGEQIITSSVTGFERLSCSSTELPTEGKTNCVNKSEAAFKNMLDNNPRALKRSKNAFHVDDEAYKDYNEELLDEMSTDSESNASLPSVTDPVRLFGILVPNTLKEAQKNFKEVLNLISKCATVQSELREVLQKYNHLQRVKALIKAAAEIKTDILKQKEYWTESEHSSLSCHSTVEEEEEGDEVKKSTPSVLSEFIQFEPQENELSIWGSEDFEADTQQI